MQRRTMYVALIGSWLLGSQSDLDACEASMDGERGSGTATIMYVGGCCMLWAGILDDSVYDASLFMIHH